MSNTGVFILPYLPSTDLTGIGVRLLTGARTSESALTTFELHPDPSGHDTKQTHRTCETSQTLSQVQEFAAEMEGTRSSLTVGAGLSLLFEQNVASTSIACVSVGSIQAGRQLCDPAALRLTETAQSLLDTDRNEFVKRFGTHFVAGYVLGANFFSSITISTRSAASKSKIAASIRADYDSGSFFKAGAKASAEARSRFESAVSENSARISGVYHATGVSDRVHISDLQSVAEAFANFSAMGPTATSRLQAVCMPYTMVPQASGASDLIPDLNGPIVDAICREVRRSLAARGEINSYDAALAGRPDVHAVSETYRGRLNSRVDWFRRLPLDSIKHGNTLSPELLDRLSMKEDGSTTGAAHSAQIFAAWKSEFQAAYNRLL